jgi:hypothetical protein
MTQADFKKLETIQAKKDRASKKIQGYRDQIEALAQSDKSDGYFWLIGAWCPS